MATTSSSPASLGPSQRLLDDRYLRAPDLVDLWLEVADPGEVLRRAGSGRRRLRMLRRMGLTWSISHHPADFERFYTDFYTASARARFRDLRIVQAHSVLRRRFRFGGLMWIERDSQAIAGQLFEPKGNVLRLLSVGTADGRQEYRRLGALQATILFASDHARATGKAWLGPGGSLPSLKDGSLMNKRSWGGLLREREDCHRDFVVRWPAFNRRVARFLDDVPLVIRDGRELSALTALSFASPPDPTAAFRRWRQLAPRDLHRFYVMAPHGWHAIRAGTALPPSDCVWLCDPGPSESVIASARGDVACRLNSIVPPSPVSPLIGASTRPPLQDA